MWISWKILFTSLRLHLYFKCQSNPGFFPIYPPIILKSCSAITRGETEVLSLTWGSLLTLNNKTGTEYAVWFCSVIIISPLKHQRPKAKTHTPCAGVDARRAEKGYGRAAFTAGREEWVMRQMAGSCSLPTQDRRAELYLLPWAKYRGTAHLLAH